MVDERWGRLLPSTIERASGTIHHYTDPGALLGMIEKRELWATEATGMNDLSEVRQGWQFIRTWVREQSDEDWIIQMIRDATEDGHPANVVDGVFMCCATTRRDDANQWRLYASSGRGYSVALDAGQQLAALSRTDARPEPKGDKGSPYRRLIDTAWVTPWLHVLYTKDEKEGALAEFATRARKAYDELLRQGLPADEFDVEGQILRDEIMSGVATIAQLMKSEGFAGEHEVRVIATIVFDGCSRFRATGNGVVRYVRLTTAPSKAGESQAVVYRRELDEASTLPVLEVWLGPLLNAQNNEGTIRSLLTRNQLNDVKVHSSDVPLRG